MADLLVVEDDEAIAGALAGGLRQHGHQVSVHHRASTALSAVAGRTFDLVLLDLGLPDLDGVEVCRRIRAALPAAVIVMLTARTDEMDVVLGLEAGADDYLTKPFRLAELLARVRAHLRRTAPVRSGPPVVALGSLVVDVAARRATVAGREVDLRTKEFDLLARLAAEPGRAVSREVLMTDVWDAHWYGSTKTLDVHVAALRRKLAGAAEGAASGGGAAPEGGAPDGGVPDGGAAAPRISTLRGHGYRLEDPAT